MIWTPVAPGLYGAFVWSTKEPPRDRTCARVLVWAAEPRLDFSSPFSRALPALPCAALEGYDEFVFSYLWSKCQNILLKRDLVSKYSTSDSMGMTSCPKCTCQVLSRLALLLMLLFISINFFCHFKGFGGTINLLCKHKMSLLPISPIKIFMLGLQGHVHDCDDHRLVWTYQSLQWGKELNMGADVYWPLLHTWLSDTLPALVI